MKKTKRVLIVAGEFPPFKTIGRIRSLKLSKYLSSFGWEPIVLTVNETASGPYDPATLLEIPKGVPIYRAYFFEPERKAIQVFKKISGIGRVSERSSSGVSTHRGKEFEGEEKSMKALLIHAKKSLDRFIARNILIPDDLLLWSIHAALLGKRICREHHVDLIFSTAPPFTDLLVGRLIKGLTRLPWVADYRDLWTGDVLRDWVPGWRRKVEVALERRILSRADAVIAVSQPKVASLQERLPDVPQERFYCITNGYDLDEYEGDLQTGV